MYTCADSFSLYFFSIKTFVPVFEGLMAPSTIPGVSLPSVLETGATVVPAAPLAGGVFFVGEALSFFLGASFSLPLALGSALPLFFSSLVPGFGVALEPAVLVR